MARAGDPREASTTAFVFRVSLLLLGLAIAVVLAMLVGIGWLVRGLGSDSLEHRWIAGAVLFVVALVVLARLGVLDVIVSWVADPIASPRRLRATFLLRLVILLGSIALVASTVLVGLTLGWTVAAGIAGILGWFLGVEGGLLPILFEHLATRSADARGQRGSSLWFVDEDHERRRRMQDHFDDTQDNPTIR